MAIGVDGVRTVECERARRTVDAACRVYGYDPSATLNDAATLNNTTRNDATDNDSTHDDLATPTTTTRPTLNVNAD